MSHYLDLSDERKIEVARDAVRCGIPIAPVIAGWLNENKLLEQVTNPKANNTHGGN